MGEDGIGAVRGGGKNGSVFIVGAFDYIWTPR